MLTMEQIHLYLDVDLDTGIVIWKCHRTKPHLAGRQAGHVNNGYRRMGLLGYEFYIYQLIWFVAYGEWPTFTIDHADTDSLNDSLDNLRRASKGQNAANSGMNVRNTSGFKGVSGSHGRWQAFISVDGISKYLGTYTTPELAHKAWYNAAINAWGEEFVRAL